MTNVQHIKRGEGMAATSITISKLLVPYIKMVTSF